MPITTSHTRDEHAYHNTTDEADSVHVNIELTNYLDDSSIADPSYKEDLSFITRESYLLNSIRNKQQKQRLSVTTAPLAVVTPISKL